ncbi:MAG: hypothetical protein ACOYX1_03675 [Acidobacteriota bacterium]
MEMLLMALCISLFGLAVAALSFSAATSGQEREGPAPAAELEVPLAEPAPSQFFVDGLKVPEARPRVPLEALLLELENHVRLEQAAAESFLAAPSSSLLHCRTTSPLIH